MRVMNITTKVELANTVKITDSFFARLKGLLGTSCLAVGCCLVLKPCKIIHTFGMNYPIDVVFVGADNKILKIISALQAGYIAFCRDSSYAIEFPANSLGKRTTRIGDKILIQ